MSSHIIDRTGWPEGPWTQEPDKVFWKDETTGLDCLIVRASSGYLCGYVGVALSSPLAGKDYDFLNESGVRIHGGLTYAGRCAEPICHPADEEIYWYGFDCAHCFDFSSIRYGNRKFEKTYRDMVYVKRECAKLATQIKTLEASC